MKSRAPVHSRKGRPVRRSPTGRWIRSIDGHETFVPDALPRVFDLDRPRVYLLDEASRGVAMLAGVGETLPNPYLLIRPFVRREAVLSSRIEGTQSSLSDLYLFEATGGRQDLAGDAREVANYVAALEHGLQRLADLPLTVRLLNEIHKRLMTGVRGSDKMAGRLRRTQVWIGERGTTPEKARFVPPPADLVPDLLKDIEAFLNERIDIPPLVQIALAHYQFEAVHPYLDGNGRVGRLLITLFLCAKGVLPTPLLYLSAFFERHRARYYDLLLAVSEQGTWNEWLEFFLRGVAEQATDALKRSRRVRNINEQYRDRLQRSRASANALRAVDVLFESPLVTAALIAERLGVSDAGARGIIARLIKAGILREHRSLWPRTYEATELLDAIEQPVS
jgi:Fic family protein